MNLEKEFQYSVKDGLGSAEAMQFSIAIVDGPEREGIAYSWGKREVYFMMMSPANERPLTAIEYLDLAKKISAILNCFVAPCQKCGSTILWGSKSGNAIHAYKFRVLNTPPEFVD